MQSRNSFFSDSSPIPECEEEVAKSYIMLIIDGLNKELIEDWVKNVAQESGQRVDWHYFAGRACVKAIGDYEKVRLAMKKLLPELNQAKATHYLTQKNDKVLPRAYTENDVDKQIDKVLGAIADEKKEALPVDVEKRIVAEITKNITLFKSLGFSENLAEEWA